MESVVKPLDVDMSLIGMAINLQRKQKSLAPQLTVIANEKKKKSTISSLVPAATMLDKTKEIEKHDPRGFKCFRK